MPRFCRYCGRPGARSLCRGCSVKPRKVSEKEKAAIRRDFAPGGQYYNEQEYIAQRRMGLWP